LLHTDNKALLNFINTMLKQTALYILCFFIYNTALAQAPALFFERLTTQNKLSHNKVNCILQDRRGFMWIGTNDGLNRFDGYNVTVFRNHPQNKASLSGNIITAMLEDKDGVLWIATSDGGLTKYDYKQEPHLQFTQFKHIPQDSASIPVNELNALVQQGDYLWLATSARSVIRFNTKTNQFDKSLPVNSRKSVLSLSLDDKGWLWAGQQGGSILKINTSSLQTVADSRYNNLYAGLPHTVVTALYRTTDGIMWYGSWDKQVYYSNATNNNEVNMPAKANTINSVNDVILSFAEDSKQRLWMGGRDAGLHVYDKVKNVFYHYTHNPMQDGSLADNTINCVYVDKQNRIWLGTNRGISISNPYREQFVQQFLPHTDNAPVTIYDFYKTADNTLWIGTSNGIYLQKPGITDLIHRQVLHNNKPLAVSKFFIAQDGSMYIGTDYSLFLYNAVNNTVSLLANTEKDQVMNKIIESRVVSITPYELNGNPVLFTLPYGHYMTYYDQQAKKWVSRLDSTEKIIQRYSLADNLIRKMYKTADNVLWLGFGREGLGKWQPATSPQVQYFKNNPAVEGSLSNNNVYDIVADSSGNLWVATFGGGLNYFDVRKQHSRHITITNNLLEGIATDVMNNVWMISNGNLYRYNPSTTAYTSFAVPDLEKTGGVSGYIYKDNSGQLYAAGKNYFIGFNPINIAASQKQPEVFLTDFKIFSESFSHLINTKKIQLSYRQNYFTIDFAAPDYLLTEPVQYAYKLQGHDDDWVACGTRNFAPYSNLKEGTYTFKVKASSSAGRWSPNEYSIDIIITPPVWRRWWFFVLCALLIGGIAYAAYRYRINELLKRQAIRNKIAQDLHDSVGSTLSSVAVYSQVAHIQNENGNKQQLNDILSKISATSSDMISEMNDIVWAINPRNDSIEKIVQRMESFAKPLLAARNINFAFVCDEALLHTNLEMDKRKNFYLIFKEAVNNVIKYSGASTLKVNINIQKNMLQLIVEDNGVGFNVEAEITAQSLSGNGLRNMKMRAKEMNGQLQIISSAGEGTTVQLVCPIP
jgi:streptogramin lyase